MKLNIFAIVSIGAFAFATSPGAASMVVNGLTMPEFATNASFGTVSGTTMTILSNNTDGTKCLEGCFAQMDESLAASAGDDCEDRCYVDFGIKASEIAVSGTDDTQNATTVITPGKDGSINLGAVTSGTKIDIFRRLLDSMENMTSDKMKVMIYIFPKKFSFIILISIFYVILQTFFFLLF